MKLSNYAFLVIGLLFLISCSKSSENDSPELKVITIKGDQPFHSTDLTDEFTGVSGSYLPQDFSFEDRSFSNILFLYRYKEFNEPNDMFLYNASGLVDQSATLSGATIANTNVLENLIPNYIGYNFSNPTFTILGPNSEPGQQLIANSHNEIDFELIVNGDCAFQGNFPQLTSLEKEGIKYEPIEIPLSEGKTIYWNAPEVLHKNFIKIHITHRTTESDNGLVPKKIFTVPDIGSFSLTPAMLTDYQNGDWVSIRITRDIFVQESSLLIRSAETQLWLSVPIL